MKGTNLPEKKEAVLLFTRVPVPGATKTRLMPDLSGEECARVHAGFIRTIYETCKSGRADVLVFHTPEDSQNRLGRLLFENQPRFLQEGEGLGERMRAAFLRAFQMGYEACVLIGTDVPQISPAILETAFSKLVDYDVVINPTRDGGYYLIGMKRDYREIWTVPSYGTSSVIGDTLEHIRALGLTVYQGEVLQDIDTIQDLLDVFGGVPGRLPKDCVHCGSCTKACEFLKKYRLDLEGFSKRKDLAFHCFLCGRCQEVCPKGIDGRRLSLAMRKEAGLPGNVSYRALLLEKDPYRFSSYKKGKGKSALFMGCNFPSFFPKTARALEAMMKEHGIGVIYDCCGKPVEELSRDGHARAHLETMRKKLENAGVQELVMVCPNCYEYLKDRLGIPMVTVYRKLFDLGLGRTFAGESLPMYYPCPDRKEKEMAKDLRLFFSEPETDAYRGIQCCGLGGCACVREPELSKRFAKKAKEAGPGRLYTYCASCVGNFRRQGFLEAYHVLPLILEVEEELPAGIWPLLHRMKHRFF